MKKPNPFWDQVNDGLRRIGLLKEIRIVCYGLTTILVAILVMLIVLNWQVAVARKMFRTRLT